MLYSVHAWNGVANHESFRGFPANHNDPVLAVQCSLALLEDNPQITLVLLRLWFQVVRFDHELGGLQFIRTPGDSNIIVRITRLINLLPHGTETRVFRQDVLLGDRKPLTVQLNFLSIQDTLQHMDKLIPYLHDDPPSNIIVPVL
jgi:hypothetical protein